MIRNIIIQYIFSNNTIFNRDIKPENMLLKFDSESDGFNWLNIDIKKLTLKLSDFGLCRQISESRASESIMMSVVGTLSWLAPEVKQAMVIDTLKEAPYSKYSDIWACGCVSYYMLKKKAPSMF